jgi:hypothetical protein
MIEVTFAKVKGHQANLVLFDQLTWQVHESQMAGTHATTWIACRMPDWLYFGDFYLISKQIELAGARSKCFGNFDARIQIDRN